jgi:dimethylamine monooxygenase subunit B
MSHSATGEMRLVVTAISEPAPRIRSVTFAAEDGRELPGFVPGSHIVVECGDAANAYSLTTEGIAPSEYGISVLRADDSRGGSTWVHELKTGDRVKALPPRSAFAPVAGARKHLLIAGGIGVTPIVSHLRAAKRRGQGVQVLYRFRAGAAAHIDDVRQLAGNAAGFYTDRESFYRALGAALVAQPMGTHLYVCGPNGLIDHVLERATEFGWPQSRLHSERFGADALDPGEPFELKLAGTATTLMVPSGVSMLAALEGAGIDVPNLCRQGVCGECRIAVTGGKPLHRDLFLSDDEKLAGDAVMPCVSRADGACLEVAPA